LITDLDGVADSNFSKIVGPLTVSI